MVICDTDIWVWRYQRGNQNPYLEEQQTTQLPKEKIQKDKQRSAIETKHTHQTKDRVTRTLLKARGERRCSGRMGSSCCTSGTCRANLVTNSEHIRGHLYNRYSVTVNQVMVVIVKLSKWLCGMLGFLFYYFTMKH